MGYQETADAINSSQDHGRNSQVAWDFDIAASPEQSADNGNAGDRIGTGHQGGVQSRWNLRNDLEANEHR